MSWFFGHVEKAAWFERFKIWFERFKIHWRHDLHQNSLTSIHYLLTPHEVKAVKFGQLIEYNMKKNFFKGYEENEAGN